MTMTSNIVELFEKRDLKSIKRIIKGLKSINDYVYVKDGNSLNLLHFCAGIQDEDFSESFLKYLLTFEEIDVNSKAIIDRNFGITAGHMAAQWGHYKTLNTLINSGADLFLSDSYGSNVRDYALNSDEKESQTCIDLIDKTINTRFTTHSMLSSLNKCQTQEPKQDLMVDKIVVKQKPIDDWDSTEIYFNHDVSDNSDSSRNTLISNISYEKSDTIKSCNDETETYIYKDNDYDVLLIEERHKGSQSLKNVNQSDLLSIGNVTKNSDDKEIDEIVNLMSNSQLRNELRAMGDSPGPIIRSTRNLYVKRLGLMRKGKYSPTKQQLLLKGYSLELNRLIQNTFPFEEAVKLEQQLIKSFDKDMSKKIFFNYILIDPIVSQSITFEGNIAVDIRQLDTKLFENFIKSIFYVGKGQGNRAYEHFYEAVKSENINNKQMPEKIERILKIWSTKKGVISLHCFPSICSDEALTREALMIDALVLSNLTNKQIGQYKCHMKWNDRKKRIMGSYFLFKAFYILILNGERQIKRPANC